MHGPLLSAVHHALAAHGFTCVKFNFPYKERGRRPPDRVAVLEQCYRTVLDAVRAEIAPAKLVIGGKSMGGRMASHLAASGEAVDGLLFLGYPLHPAGKPEKLRDAHLPRIEVPMLFFAGTRDPLCRLDLLRRTVRSLRAPVEVHVVDGADHSFHVLKSMQREADDVCQEIVAASTGWLDRLGH
jgi:predicted alpha/beta-hydrolase family hydrolase